MILHDFLAGLSAYGRAISISHRLGLWKYWALPGFIGLFLAGILFTATWQLGGHLGDDVVDWYAYEFGKDLVSKAAPWLLRVLAMLLGVLLYKYILLIVLSPFMSLLSERLEARLDGEVASARFSLSRAMKEMIRGMRLAMRNIWRELILVALLTILSFFGPLSLVTAPLIFIVQAYYAGFGNFDFTLERHYSLRDSISFVRNARGSATANGAVFLLLIASVVGVFFAPTWATIAGTLEVRRLAELD